MQIYSERYNEPVCPLWVVLGETHMLQWEVIKESAESKYK